MSWSQGTRSIQTVIFSLAPTMHMSSGIPRTAPRLSVEAAKKAGLPTDLDFRIKYLIGDYRPPREKRSVVAGPGGSPMPNYFVNFEIPCPPSTWRNVDFNDESWMEAPETGSAGHRCTTVRSQTGRHSQTAEMLPPKRERLAMIWGTDQFRPEIGFICMRGTFLVTDPAKVKNLSLSLSCRGGFVAYLNGKEVARASLPEGRLDPTTSAEEHPLEVYTGPGGEPILDKWLTTNCDFDNLEPR